MIVISWDGDETINDGVNFDAYLLPDALWLAPVEAQPVRRQGARPLIGGVSLPERILTLEVLVRAGDANALRRLFDTSDGTPRTLLVSDDDGTNRRFVQAVCTAFRTAADSALTYEAQLMLHDDVYWRAETETVVTWSITSSPSSLVVNNTGRATAQPRIVARPTVNKTSDNPYKQFAILRWRAPRSAARYPVDIAGGSLDTRTSSTNFTSATLDDMRVVVNGVEVDFWPSGPNTANTKVWVNLDFQPAQSFTLDGGIGSSDTDIVVNQAIDDMPASGLLEIGGEVIAYTSKNDQQRRFSDCTRGARGSTAGSHSSGATATWLQHDILITYGATSPTAYTSDDDYKPIFDLANSTNTSWVFADFGEDDGLRVGAWVFTNLETTAKYTANRNTDADPWSEMGVRSDTSQSFGRSVNGHWSIYNPCGITGANFTNGERYSTNPSRWEAYVRSSINGAAVTNEYTIAAPASANSWSAWSQNVSSLTAGSLYVYLWLLGVARSSTSHRLEVADVTLTLNSSLTPTTALVAEQGNYKLEATITNETAGQALKLAYAMKLNDEIELDTAARSVTDLADNSNQLQALTLLGGVRVDWLPLLPGDNTIKFEDTGTAGVTVSIYYRRRYRE